MFFVVGQRDYFGLSFETGNKKKIENLQIATLETNIERGERVFSNKQRDSLVYQRETVHIA